MKQESNNQLNLSVFFNLLLGQKWLIIIITTLAAGLSVVYVMTLPNIFKSIAVVEHVRESDNDFSGAAQLGQLANLAGLSLAAGNSTDNKSVDIATIQSYDFLSEFIARNNLLIPLFAAINWQIENNEILLDPNVYEDASETWVREVKAPFKPEPSLQEAVKMFKEILNVEVDRLNGLVSISIDFVSPYVAQSWLQLLIEQFNEYVRRAEIDIYDKHLEYLTAQVTDLQNQEIRNVLFSLIEQEQKKAMLANVSEDYVFRMIDSPVAPERKDSPKRALICATATVSGFVFAIFLVFFRQLLKED